MGWKLPKTNGTLPYQVQSQGGSQLSRALEGHGELMNGTRRSHPLTALWPNKQSIDIKRDTKQSMPTDKQNSVSKLPYQNRPIIYQTPPVRSPVAN